MEFSSKKYLILLILICVVFVIFIVKAYDYLPDKSTENNYPMVNTQVQNINNNQLNTNNNSETETKLNADPNRHKSGHIDYMHSETSSNKPEYEEIKAPSGAYEEDINTSDNNSSKLSQEELAIKSFVNAQKYRSEHDYNLALTELQKIPEYTTDKETLAMSYEKIAELYAIQKRYGTALSFAGKAYSASPNAYREFLMIKIYYQSGDTDKAISKLNDLINKSFRD